MKGKDSRIVRRVQLQVIGWRKNLYSVVSICAKSCKKFWNLLFLPFLSVVAKRVGIGTGIAIISLFAILISQSVQTNTSSTLATHELGGINAQHFSLTLASDSEGPISPLPNSFKNSEDRQSVNGVLLSTVPAYAHTHDSEYNNVMQVFSKKMNAFNSNFWSLPNLLVLCFMLPELNIRIAFAFIMILGLGLPGILMSRLAATSSPWFDFPLLMYIIAYCLVLSSLILKCTPRRESQSYLMAGLAYSCAMLGILSIIVSSVLPLEFSCVLILIILVLAALLIYSRLG